MAVNFLSLSMASCFKFCNIEVGTGEILPLWEIYLSPYSQALPMQAFCMPYALKHNNPYLLHTNLY